MKRDTFGLHALVDGFLFTLQSEGRAAKTVKYYSTLLRPFLAYADSHAWPDRVDLIDTQHIREFLSWVSTRKVEYRAGNGSRRTTAPTPVTAWNYFKAVRRLFNWAVQEHLVESNPVANIHFKRPPSAPVMPYSKQDLQKLLSVCDLDVKSGARFVGLRGKAVILLFIDTLARLNELEKLGMNDLDLQQKLARVVRKGGEVQYLPFSAGTAKILWFYLYVVKPYDTSRLFW